METHKDRQPDTQYDWQEISEISEMQENRKFGFTHEGRTLVVMVTVFASSLHIHSPDREDYNNSILCNPNDILNIGQT